jgi:WD40 repeat protein
VFSPSGERLYTGTSQGDVYAWSSSDWTQLAKTHCFNNGVVRLSISADGLRLAAASRALALVDTQHFEVTTLLHPHLESMWYCEWSPDGQRLASTAMDGTIAISDPRALRERLQAATQGR